MKLKKLINNFFPVAGMKVIFITKDNKIHCGRYDFNKTKARRWIDEITFEEFTSNLIDKWVLIK